MRFILLSVVFFLSLFSGCTRIDELRFGETKLLHVYESDQYLSSPSAVQLKSGEMLLTFRSAEDPVSLSGKLLLIRSLNYGVTWTEPDTVLNTPWDCREPSITQIRNGVIFLSFIQTPTGSRFRQNNGSGVYIVRSYNDGKTFTAPQRISVPRFSGTEMFDNVLELNDGTLILAVTGVYADGSTLVMAVISSDGGETWDEFHVISEDRRSRISYGQPSLIQTPDGRILCIFESSDSGFMQSSFSEDNGMSWSIPKETSIYGKNGDIGIFPDGLVVCAFADTWPRGISTIRSYNWGSTWESEISLAGQPEGILSPSLCRINDKAAVFFAGPGKKEGFRQITGILFLFQKPATPKGFTASITNKGQVELCWNKVENASYYIVYRDRSSDFKPQIGILGNILATPTFPRFTDTPSDSGTVYYRVTAVAGTGPLTPGAGSESDPTEDLKIDIP